MKEQLKVQEVELKQKNEEANKLIQVVGVETAKVRNNQNFQSKSCNTIVYLFTLKFLIDNKLNEIMKKLMLNLLKKI